MTEQEYIRQLEQVIARFLQPLRDIPFPIVIRALYGFEVLSFDQNERRNRELLKMLIQAAEISGRRAHQEGIFARRPNEAGNKVEPYVKEALREIGLNADTPRTRSGRRKTAGYPDLEIRDRWERVIYLDCKTYTARTREQTFRTFYFSPSPDPKITQNAYHLLLTFELREIQRRQRRCFVPVHWEIYTLEDLRGQIKHEFNANNRQLYHPEALLAEGEIRR